MEFLTDILGLVASWYGLLIFVALCWSCETKESHGWAIFWGLCLTAAAGRYFNLALTGQQIGLVLLAYIPIGLVWSFYRYRRYCVKKAEDFITDFNKQMKDSVHNQERATPLLVDTLKTDLAYISPSRMGSEITAWVIIWPVSMVENLLSDLAHTVYTLVTNYFSGVYKRIHNATINSVSKSVMEKHNITADLSK